MPLEDTLVKMNQVRAKQLMECMERWFCKEEMAFALVGNLSEVPEELKEIEGLKSFF